MAALFVTTSCFVGSPDQMMTEAHRVLKPGGRLVIGFIDRQSHIGQTCLEHQAECVFYREEPTIQMAILHAPT